MDRLLLDVRHALRGLRTRPLFAAVAAASLAVGIGATTGIFSVVNGLLLRPLPGIESPDRVVELGRGRAGDGFDTFTYPDFRDLRESAAALEAASAYGWASVSVARGGEGIRAYATYAESSYFDVLGLVPARGRFWDAAADREALPVAVLSWSFWQNRLGGDPAVIGSTVSLNRVPHTVVGVAPEAFAGHMIGFQPDVLLPFSRHPEFELWAESRNSSWHWAVGRLAPDAELDELRSQLETLSGRLADAYPETNERRTFHAEALGPVPAGGRGQVGLFLAVLMGLVVLVLLVTCANVAGMFLARASDRQREVSLRMALGAGRGAVMRQLTLEALAVFAVGGALGWGLALWSTSLVGPDLVPIPVPFDFDVTPDLTVLLFATAATLATGLAFGSLPAAQATRVDPGSALRAGARGASGRTSRLRHGFVSAQVGLSLVLLVAAGLFVRSLQRAASTETGFDPSHTWMTSVDLSLEGYDGESGRVMQGRLLDALAAQGWVDQAALAVDLPLDMGSKGTVVIPAGWPGDAEALQVDFNQVSPGYFRALRIGVRAGRGFEEADGAGAEGVAVVSRSFAEAAWGEDDPLGRTLSFGSRDPARGTTLRVVGVVDDVKNQLITDAPRPFVYTALAQRYDAAVQIVVRTRPGMAGPGPAIREVVLGVDPSLSLGPVVQLERYTEIGVLPQRLAASLTTALGAVALLLAGLGVYGVVAYTVGQQTRAIGIRMALGADRGHVVGRVLRGGLWIVLPGIAAGALLALAAGNVLRSFLLGVSPFDAATLAAVTTGMVAVVGLATWIPARRAASVDPAVALRAE